jgi:hypothetical protein
MSFARRNPATSRFSASTSAAPCVVVPGRAPASTSAWRTQSRSVCAVAIPSSAAIDTIAWFPDGY